MAQIKLQGPATGSYHGTLTVTNKGVSRNRQVPSFKTTSLVLPMISGPQFVGDTATLDASRLTNVTSIQWRVRGGANLGTASTQVLEAAGQYTEVATVSDQGSLVSPPIFVHAPMANTSHNAMDAALLALGAHNKMTKCAAQSGPWSSASTWVGGNVPVGSDSVLIPNGVAVVYDVDAPATMIRRLRVDGDLSFATDTNTHLYVRDITGDRAGSISIGNSVNDRIGANNQAVITIEGQTSLDLAEDPELLSRGLVTLGTLNVFGADKLNHSRAAFGVASGSTNIELEKTPVGWGVGDEIIIGATNITLPDQIGQSISAVADDEIVTITGVSGNVVTFSPALTKHHNNRNTRTQRTDVRPMVQLRANSRNVIIKSEALTPVDKRGHVMAMHMNSRLDMWDCGLIGLGRTDKSLAVGQRTAGGMYEYSENGAIQEVALTATANIRGRYSLHAHSLGYDHEGMGRPIPLVVNVTIEDNPGWGLTHHDCEMNLRGCSTFLVYGCGVVAEQGAETGEWHDLSVMQATATNRTTTTQLSNLPKGQMGTAGLAGDFFNFGYGFGYRGRAIVTTECVATTCSYGHVFWHRGYSAGNVLALFDVTNPPRARIDLKEVGLFSNNFSLSPYADFHAASFPIIHFADCGAIACGSGTYVSKQVPTQGHDYSVIWKGFFSHGYADRGVLIEYVGTYILMDIDCVAGINGDQGIDIGNNCYQIAIVRPRTDGNLFNGIRVSGVAVETSAVADDFDATTDPRFWVIGQDSNDPTAITYTNQVTKTFAQVAVVDPDYDSSYIDYGLIPTQTFPETVATWGGTTAAPAASSLPTNTTGLKFGNHPVGLPISTKTWDDSPFPAGGTIQMREMVNAVGYYQVGGNDVLVQREIISDVLSGRPAKFTALWQADNPVDFSTDHGPVVMGAGVTAPDILLTVAPGGSVTFSAIANVTGGTGSYEIDPGDFTAPDYGKFSMNYATGDVTYTPRVGVSGKSDFGYISVRNLRETGATKTETRTYATRKVSILISDATTMLAPVVGTDLTVANGTGSFGVTLLQKPNSGGRRIYVTEYSTDAGTTWRRLCNGYPLTPLVVTLDSAGGAITGGTYNVIFRYYTDYDGRSPASNPAVSVTVS